jgi:hypothetical protein
MDFSSLRAKAISEGKAMDCAKHDNLRREWLAARAGYQIALANLQNSSQSDDFRSALQHANEAFAEFNEAEAALDRHLRTHGCTRIPAMQAAAHFAPGLN